MINESFSNPPEGVPPLEEVESLSHPFLEGFQSSINFKILESSDETVTVTPSEKTEEVTTQLATELRKHVSDQEDIYINLDDDAFTIQVYRNANMRRTRA